jgi:hypothetical protein
MTNILYLDYDIMIQSTVSVSSHISTYHLIRYRTCEEALKVVHVHLLHVYVLLRGALPLQLLLLLPLLGALRLY